MGPTVKDGGEALCLLQLRSLQEVRTGPRLGISPAPYRWKCVTGTTPIRWERVEKWISSFTFCLTRDGGI